MAGAAEGSDQIYSYLNDGAYPEGFEKSDKLSLRKRSKFFSINEGSLFYVGGPGR